MGFIKTTLVAALLVIIHEVNGAVQLQELRESGVLKQVIVENNYLRVKIIRKGGRVISFYNKQRNVEMTVSGNAPFDGVCKTRDWILHNNEPHSVNYELKILKNSPEKVVIEASRNLKTAALTGCLLTKRYMLTTGVARLDVTDKIKCQEKRALFQLNSHNQFSMKAFSDKGLMFYSPSKHGMVCFSSKQANINSNNIVYDVSAPWMAVIGNNTNNGVAVLAHNIKTLDAMFAWAGTNTFTIEPIFSKTTLQPVAEADIAEFSYSLIPLHGLPAINYLNDNLAFNVKMKKDNALLTAYFPAYQGEATIKIIKADKTISEKTLNIKAGSTTEISFTPTTEIGPYTIVISKVDREIRTQFNLPIETAPSYMSPDTQIKKEQAITINGFYYYYDTLWLSSDIWTNIAFGLNGNFADKKNFRLVLELPATINIRPIGKVKYESQSIKKDGQPWKKHIIYAGRKATYFSAVTMLFRVDTTFKGPVKAKLQTVWDGGELPAETVTIKSVSLPVKMPQLKTLQLGIHTNTKTLDAWPNYLDDLQKLGVNFVEIWDWPAATILTKHLGNGVYDDYVQAMNKKGIEVSMECSTPFESAHRVLKKIPFYYKGAQTLFHPEKKANPFDVEDAKIVTINGRKLDNICPSYRGPYYDKVLDMVKSAIDYGVSNIQYDEETYAKGAIICFCDRCKTKFNDYLAKNHPELTYIDPTVFEQTPAKYKELDEAWWQFKTDQVADVYKAIKQTMNEYKNPENKKRKLLVYVDASVGEGRYGAISTRLTDYAKLAKHVDCLIPMVYTVNSEVVGDCVANTQKAVKGQADAAVALSPNRAYELHRVISQNFPSLETVRYQIIEAFFAGGRLVHFWAPYCTLKGAGSFREIANAVKTVAPVEDILVDGHPDKTVKSSNSELRIRAIRSNDSIAIMVGEYSDDIINTTITCPVQKPSNVVDTATGKTIAQINTAHPTFKLKLASDRVRVLLVQPK
jgi:hypothetical protein